MVTKEIKNVIIIAVGITILLLGIWFAFGELNLFYVVASGSMIPNLNINDFVIVSHNVPFNSLKVGDIIVFKTYGTDDSGQHVTIVHRVAEIVTDPSNGQKVMRTKGDANSLIDIFYLLPMSRYIHAHILVFARNLQSCL